MRCPYCAEKIQSKAIICKHCNRELPPRTQSKLSTRTIILIVIGVLISCCLITMLIANALEKAEIARNPVAATINAMETATQKAIPTLTKTLRPTKTLKPSKTHEPTNTPRPSSTPKPTSTTVQDGAIQLLMDVVGLTKEEAVTTFDLMKAVGYSRLTKLEFDQEMSPLKFYLADTGFSTKTILAFEGSQLFGINQGGVKQLYDRDAGGVIDNIENYVLPQEDKSTYIYLAEEIVKSALKSPSTAKFPNSFFESDEWKVSRNHDVITVVSWVDAQNSFGAMIRSTFAVQYSYSTNELLYLLLDGQILYGSEH